MRFLTIHQPDAPGVPFDIGSNATKRKTRALRRIIRIKRKLDGVHTKATPSGHYRKRLNRQVRELAKVAGL